MIDWLLVASRGVGAGLDVLPPARSAELSVCNIVINIYVNVYIHAHVSS